VNEPLEGWWFKGGYHEAMSMEPQGILDLGVKVKEQLRELGAQGHQAHAGRQLGAAHGGHAEAGDGHGEGSVSGGVGAGGGARVQEIPVSATQELDAQVLPGCEKCG